MRYAFIRDQAGTHRMTRLCTALGVSRSGYYAWRQRPLSVRREADQRLLPVLCRLHRQTREEYGAIKLWQALKKGGIQGGRHRVARLRKLAGLEARRVRRFRVIVEHHQLPPPAPNLLQQRFVTTALDTVWVGDFTAVPSRLAVCGRAPGSVLPTGDRLGDECQARSTPDARRAHDGRPTAASASGAHSSLRSGRSI